jgi:hypothetical protein
MGTVLGGLFKLVKLGASSARRPEGRRTGTATIGDRRGAGWKFAGRRSCLDRRHGKSPPSSPHPKTGPLDAH